VVRLKRTGYGILQTGELKTGEYRMLTPAELKGLRSLSMAEKRPVRERVKKRES
jgi:16S rRNA U516 pseudouridylate synthase RsuA-like enzyme